MQAYCSAYKYFFVFALKNLELALILKPRKHDTGGESASVPNASGNRPVLAGRSHKGVGKGQRSSAALNGLYR
jgi:hypothetical protein